MMEITKKIPSKKRTLPVIEVCVLRAYFKNRRFARKTVLVHYLSKCCVSTAFGKKSLFPDIRIEKTPNKSSLKATALSSILFN